MNGFHGVAHAYSLDESVRLEFIIGVTVYAILIVFLWPVTGSQLSLLLLSFFLVLITELVNTSIETLLARIHPIRHHLIGMSKDIAAGAVLMAVIFASCVMVILILSKLGVIAW